MSGSAISGVLLSDAQKSAPVADSTPASLAADWRLVLLVVWLASSAYVFWHLGRGWMPFDDGALAQSAERLIQGQLPHRDFDEIYTGGLTVLNATAFRLLGTSLWTLRVVLFAVFVAWVPAVFYIASRLARPVVAGAVTLLAVVWSLPNYSAALPSWYNLFLATFGVAALFRYLEVERAWWLVVAGIAGGLSFLVKVVGLYDVAGVLLFLVFHVHARSRMTAAVEPQRGRVYAAFVTLSLLLFVAALWSVIRRQLHAPEVVQFVVPGMLIALLLVRNEWTLPAGASRARFEMLARLLVPFLAGVALPVAVFLIPYALSGSLGAFVNGVFVLPMRRFDTANLPALPLVTMFALVPFALIVLAVQRVERRRLLAILFSIVLSLVLAISNINIATYRLVWNAARNLLPVLVLIGVAVLLRERHADARDPLLRARTMILIAVTALCSLVQFPFAAANYFCYIAPLVALSALALHSYLRPTRGASLGLVIGFLIAFAVFRSNGTPLYRMGVAYQPPFPMTTLALERGGIEVPSVQATAYGELIPLLEAHARGGYTWASPDTPEIYFLAGLRNPTRSLFEFFEDSTGYQRRTLDALDARGVTAVVINRTPYFSHGVTQEMYAQLRTRYPRTRSIGPFQLRWRD
ncbi:MAG: hypothetical protein ABJE10_01385 [bacterium]